jgi:hypothetical protein
MHTMPRPAVGPAAGSKMTGPGGRAPHWMSGNHVQWARMNVEKTIAFLLDNHAKSVERLDRMERLQARTDRRVDAIAKLVRLGMNMLVNDRKNIAELRRLHKETDYKINALIESHNALIEKSARSDEKFERLLAALLRKRTNGHG